jgi:hypothetical protein
MSLPRQCKTWGKSIRQCAVSRRQLAVIDWLEARNRTSKSVEIRKAQYDSALAQMREIGNISGEAIVFADMCEQDPILVGEERVEDVEERLGAHWTPGNKVSIQTFKALRASCRINTTDCLGTLKEFVQLFILEQKLGSPATNPAPIFYREVQYLLRDILDKTYGRPDPGALLSIIDLVEICWLKCAPYLTRGHCLLMAAHDVTGVLFEQKVHWNENVTDLPARRHLTACKILLTGRALGTKPTVAAALKTWEWAETRVLQWSRFWARYSGVKSPRNTPEAAKARFTLIEKLSREWGWRALSYHYNGTHYPSIAIPMFLAGVECSMHVGNGLEELKTNELFRLAEEIAIEYEPTQEPVSTSNAMIQRVHDHYKSKARAAATTDGYHVATAMKSDISYQDALSAAQNLESRCSESGDSMTRSIWALERKLMTHLSHLGLMEPCDEFVHPAYLDE